MPFCRYHVTAVDSVSDEIYTFEGSRMEPGSTEVLTFRVGNDDLPHNGHYMARMNISNKHSTEGLQDPISISRCTAHEFMNIAHFCDCSL